MTSRPHVKRDVTRKWAEARQVDYGGGDWGDEDEDLYGDTRSEQHNQQQHENWINQERRSFTNPIPAQPARGSFDRGDDRRYFSSGGIPQPLHLNTNTNSNPQSVPFSAPIQPSRRSEERPEESSANFPPRKDSLSRQNPPDIVSSEQKPLPFIRPADIYKRVEEEREKERRSQDSSRPSIDSNTGIVRDSENKTVLDTVPERKSEYGFENLLSNQNVSQQEHPVESHTTGRPPSSDSLYTDRVDPVSASDSGYPSRMTSQHNPTHLPDIQRMSTFGTDIWSNDQSSKMEEGDISRSNSTNITSQTIPEEISSPTKDEPLESHAEKPSLADQRSTSEEWKEWSAARKEFNAKHGIKDSNPTTPGDVPSPFPRPDSPVKSSITTDNSLHPSNLPRDTSFRPSLPGGWQSYNTLPGNETPEPPPSLPPFASAYNRTESEESIPTAMAPKNMDWRTGHKNESHPYPEAAAAGSAMMGIFSGSAFTRSTPGDSDANSVDDSVPVNTASVTRDFATTNKSATDNPPIRSSRDFSFDKSHHITRSNSDSSETTNSTGGEWWDEPSKDPPKTVEQSSLEDVPAPLRTSRTSFTQDRSKPSIPTINTEENHDTDDKLQEDIVKSLTPTTSQSEMPLSDNMETPKADIAKVESQDNTPIVRDTHDKNDLPSPVSKDTVTAFPIPPTTKSKPLLEQRFSFEDDSTSRNLAEESQIVSPITNKPSTTTMSVSPVTDKPISPVTDRGSTTAALNSSVTDKPVSLITDKPSTSLNDSSVIRETSREQNNEPSKSLPPISTSESIPTPSRNYPTERVPFRDIMAYTTSKQRVQAFNDNQKIFAEPTGHLETWLTHMRNSDHADDIFSNQSRPPASPTSGRTPPSRGTVGPMGSKQMQEDGKKLLAAAGKYGGKAGVAAKGLFAKGKDKLRTVSAGEKAGLSNSRRSSGIILKAPTPSVSTLAPQLPETNVITPLDESSWAYFDKDKLPSPTVSVSSQKNISTPVQRNRVESLSVANHRRHPSVSDVSSVSHDAGEDNNNVVTRTVSPPFEYHQLAESPPLQEVEVEKAIPPETKIVPVSNLGTNELVNRSAQPRPFSFMGSEEIYLPQNVKSTPTSPERNRNRNLPIDEQSSIAESPLPSARRPPEELIRQNKPIPAPRTLDTEEGYRIPGPYVQEYRSPRQKFSPTPLDSGIDIGSKPPQTPLTQQNRPITEETALTPSSVDRSRRGIFGGMFRSGSESLHEQEPRPEGKKRRNSLFGIQSTGDSESPQAEKRPIPSKRRLSQDLLKSVGIGQSQDKKKKRFSNLFSKAETRDVPTPGPQPISPQPRYEPSPPIENKPKQLHLETSSRPQTYGYDPLKSTFQQIPASAIPDLRPDLRIDTRGYQNSGVMSAPPISNYNTQPTHTRVNRDISYGRDSYENPQSGISQHVRQLHTRSRSPRRSLGPTEDLRERYNAEEEERLTAGLGTFSNKKMSPVGGFPRSEEEQEKPWMIGLPNEEKIERPTTDEPQSSNSTSSSKAREIRRMMLERSPDSNPTTTETETRPQTVADRFMGAPPVLKTSSHKTFDRSGQQENKESESRNSTGAASLPRSTHLEEIPETSEAENSPQEHPKIAELSGSKPDGYESEEEIIMSATAYPGQAWQPEFERWEE